MEQAHAKRLSSLRRSLRKVDAALITSLPNVRYLSGFTGSSGAIFISREDAVLVTDFRYREQAEAEAPGLDLNVHRRGIPEHIISHARKKGISVLGFEPQVSFEFYERLLKRSRNSIKLRPMRDMVERLREVKDTEEVKLVREAIRRAEGAFARTRPHIRAGVSERSIARRLEGELKKAGCSRLPFEIIVASGPNSSMPHAHASDRRLRSGDLVVIDWGGECDGYFSDMTRTLLLRGGEKLALKRKIYRMVLDASMAATAELRPGRNASEIDNYARNIIKKGGYGEYFGHGLGHGVGLEVHEAPRLGPHARGRIKQGTILTIEPGIYLPGVGGVRIEDMVHPIGDMAVVLTGLPRALGANTI